MLFGSVIEPYTLIHRVHSLGAGHWIEVREGQVVRQRQYWNAVQDQDCKSPDASNDASSREPYGTRRLLDESVREHMLSDVPVGCFLSGGIDSSTVTALAASLTASPLRTFTVAFHGTEMDESEYARTIAARFHTEHFEVRLSDQEVASQLPKAIEAMDMPSIDGANTYVVSRAVSAVGVKVVLSGLGGDEVFGGYRSFRLLPFAARWSNLLGETPSWSAWFLPGGERGRNMMKPGLELRRRYCALRSLWPEGDLARMGVNVLLELFPEPDSSLPLRTRVSQLELAGYMRSVLLRDSDVMSMAHSIELRVPFLDHRLVEHGLRHHLAGPGKKVALLRAVADLLPRRHARRAKQGFVLPMEGWLRSSLRDFAAEGLAALDQQSVLEVSAQAYQSQFEGGRMAWPRIWQLAVLGHWLTRNHLRVAAGPVAAAACLSS
jgi:asparagine synthase (glutamine-hydrolysing)